MIARKVPQRSELTNKLMHDAALYGLTPAEYRSAFVDWLENEGYDGAGNAYEDLHAWLIGEPERDDAQDQFDGGRGAGQLGQQVD